MRLFTPPLGDITANPEVLDSKLGSSGFDTEICQSNDESTSTYSAQSHYDHHQCFMATTEDTSDSDNDSDCDSDNDDNEELMLELKKIDQRVRRTVIEMMKRVMI